MRKAIFPGSFDPFTRGHWDIARRVIPMFDKLYIAVGYNISKQGLLSSDARVELIRDTFKDEPRVEVLSYNTLTVELCNKLGVDILVHGVRSFSDFEYERQIAEVNSQIRQGTENLFLLASPGYASVSSSAVRELIHHKADLTPFLPPQINIEDYLQK
ncbi:MAG: pantetheine-phosphate adenylyltransferase [Rikenellaceae bacterium]